MDQTSANPDHVNRRPSDPRAPVFIPPFRKNLEAGMPKNGVPTAGAQVPSVFVPPVKKKDTLGNVHVKDSPQVSGNSPAVTSSICERSEHHAAKNAASQKAEESMREKLEHRSSIPGETNGK